MTRVFYTKGLICLLFSNIFFLSNNVYSQEIGYNPIDTLRVIDSLVQLRQPLVEKSLVGKDIYSILGHGNIFSGEVAIEQSDSVFVAMLSHIEGNKYRKISGYRLRIFLDNSQTARVDSERVERRFVIKHPLIRTYRSYMNPYFKVSVGDFRTRSEAYNFLNKISGSYPTAFVVKEDIFPF